MKRVRDDLSSQASHQLRLLLFSFVDKFSLSYISTVQTNIFVLLLYVHGTKLLYYR